MPASDIVSRFNEIYNSTSRAALAFITAKCGRTADIGDIFQDTYMELYKVLSKRGAAYITNEKALVFRIARRKLARYYSLAARLRLLVPISAADGGEESLSGFDAGAFLTEDFAVGSVLLETARRFILSKPDDVQKIFYLHYDAGLTLAEIARSLALNESNVKNKLYRTLAELRDILK